MSLHPWLHNTFKSQIARLSTQELHHGILLIAQSGAGESSLAIALAKRILCASNDAVLACDACKACLLFNAGSHPDFHEVTSEKSQIGVDAVRGAIEQVNKTAQLSANKVVLIEQIERMSESASNALLKTLEEPTKGTYLILTSAAPQYLLATIKSRCEKIRVPLPSYAQSCEFLQAQNVVIPSEEELAAYKHSPLLYMQQLANKALDYSQFKQDFDALKQGVLSAESLANKWQESAIDAVHWTAQLSLKAFSKEVSRGLDQSDSLVSTQWLKVYDSATLASKKLRQAGLNKVLILSALFAKLHTV